MARYNSGEEDDLIRQIADLKRRIDNLESVNRAGRTSVESGLFRVNQSDGTQVFEAGDLSQTLGFPNTWGTVMRRTNGSLALVVFSMESGDGFWAGHDKQGNVILSEDGSSGQGLATPWLAMPGWTPNATLAVPTETTTSATFVGLQNVRVIKTHPKVHVEVVVRSSDGSTTGQVQLVRIDTANEIIGETISVTGSMYQRHIITGPVAGPNKENFELEVQGRRTAGAGTIGVRVIGSYFRQT